MSLSRKDSQRLRDAGFISEEISRFGMATSPSGERQPKIDLDSPAWQATMLSRIIKRNKMTKKGFDEKQQDDIFQKYYSGRAAQNRSPYDFLKVAYRPIQGFTDYGHALHRRIQNRVNKALSRAAKYVVERG